jgi:hypothetical protein
MDLLLRGSALKRPRRRFGGGEAQKKSKEWHMRPSITSPKDNRSSADWAGK